MAVVMVLADLAPGATAAGHAPAHDPLAGRKFFAPRRSPPALALRDDPAAAGQLGKIADHETAVWLTPTTPMPESTVDSTLTAAAGQIPVFVVYAIPYRDCNGYSSGGEPDASDYRHFVSEAADGVKRRRAIFILEPDALANMSGCLSRQEQNARTGMIADAVAALSTEEGTEVYIDAGHEDWQPVDVIAADLRAAGIAHARGFSLNVSNFYSTAKETRYGDAVSHALHGKTFVIDTSRNGLGPDATDQWCNPSGRALGTPATASTGSPLVDAYLWVKIPGESDGYCNGGPASGSWWNSYAIGLAERSRVKG